MTDMDEIRKMYEEINKKLDVNLEAHKHLVDAFVDATQHSKIEHDLNLKSGSGKTGEVEVGEMLDGAKTKEIKRDLKTKSGSGSSGDVPKGEAPFVDGAKTEKIKKI